MIVAVDVDVTCERFPTIVDVAGALALLLLLNWCSVLEFGLVLLLMWPDLQHW